MNVVTSLIKNCDETYRRVTARAVRNVFVCIRDWGYPVHVAGSMCGSCARGRRAAAGSRHPCGHFRNGRYVRAMCEAVCPISQNRGCP